VCCRNLRSIFWQVGYNSFATAKDLIDKVVRVDEKYIASAILRLLEVERAVVEGGGAAGLAALLSHSLPELTGKKEVFLTDGSAYMPETWWSLCPVWTATGRWIS